MIMRHPTPATFSRSLAQLEYLPIAITDRLSHLPAAIATTVDAAIWSRSLPPTVENWLDQIAARNLPDGRYIVKPSDVASSIKALFALQGLVSTPALTWLSKDAEQLSHCACEIAGTEWVRLRLEKVDDNACSKLHVDNVVARMICTYRGPGTQLGFDASTPDEIQTVPTGIPVLLKGKRWSTEVAPDLRHRSPAIKGTGITRLVLVLEGVSPEDIMPAYDMFYEDDERI